jgi:hypothetical protein
VRLYQDLSLRRVFTVALLVTLLLLCRGLAQAQFEEAGERQLVQLINQERASRGLPPLAVDQRLTQAARKHAELMAEHKALSHQFDGEPTMDLRFADEHLRSDQQAENIALNQDVPSAHEALMGSPAHRASILHPGYNVVGVAVLRSGRHVYVTEDFAHRLTAYSEPEAEAVLQRAVENYATTHGMPAPKRKPQSQLRHMACDMALNDSLQGRKVADLLGVREVAAWTTAVPSELPSSAKELLSRPMSSGYSLGACFAPSVSQPGGVYWVVMVVY